MADFAGTMTAMAMLSDEDMGRSWRWRSDGEDLGVRDGFHRTLEAELAQLVVIEAGGGWSEAVDAMALAQRALGQVLGLLAGQPDDVLDFEPAQEEWSLREVVRHMLQTEMSFCANTRWAVTRADDQPMAIPTELRPTDREAPGHGGIADLIGRLLAARAATDAGLGVLLPADLEKPSMWAGYSVDVRFRLHRFASHLTEHGIHAEKVLRAAGREPVEARQMVRAIWAARGAHERRTPGDVLARLDAEHSARVASFEV
jgi:hypothetical protein